MKGRLRLGTASAQPIKKTDKTKNKKMKIENSKKFYLALLIIFYNLNVFAQKQISITMDDPNSYDTPKLSWQERNDAILKALDNHKIKVALFVCGMRVDDLNGKYLLETWDNKDHLICNHSYSHLNLNSKSISCADYINNFKKGDSIISGYKNYTKLFRFPYLKEGNNVIKRDSIRTFLAEEKYRNGSVTVDASDWYIDSEMIKALKENDHVDLTVYKNYYIQHILDRANHYDSLAQIVFHREIEHTLLIHHSLLNALFLDDLLIALENDGWKLIDAEQAFKDPVFEKKPQIEPCGESLVWQCASQIEELSKTLRYPAEDGNYEKEPLERMVKEYERNKNRE